MFAREGEGSITIHDEAFSGVQRSLRPFCERPQRGLGHSSQLASLASHVLCQRAPPMAISLGRKQRSCSEHPYQACDQLRFSHANVVLVESYRLQRASVNMLLPESEHVQLPGDFLWKTSSGFQHRV